MRRSRLLLLVAVLVATFALPALAQARVYFRGEIMGSRTPMLFRPHVIQFGERSAIIRIRWQHWGGRMAAGRGSLEFNNCKPNCALARPNYYAVSVQLSRIHHCRSRRLYSQFFFRYSRRKPRGYPRTHTERYRC